MLPRSHFSSVSYKNKINILLRSSLPFHNIQHKDTNGNKSSRLIATNEGFDSDKSAWRPTIGVAAAVADATEASGNDGTAA